MQSRIHAAEGLAALIVIVALAAFGGWRYYVLQQAYTAAQASLASTTAAYASSTAALAGELDANQNLSQSLLNAQAVNASFQNEISTISSKVGTLTKLSQTDPQLLAKYSKVYFLNENYAPASLTAIDSRYLYDPARALQFESDAYPFLTKMIDAARADGVDISLASAYRSFSTQASLKEGYTITYGTGANAFSADQGYSEHQLGTTVDFTDTSLKGKLSGFSHTSAYAWLVANAYEYGFTLSYPPSNTYYEYEPWHWRFVGIDLATYLQDNHKYFYDLDQRTLDEYLVVLFDTSLDTISPLAPISIPGVNAPATTTS